MNPIFDFPTTGDLLEHQCDALNWILSRFHFTKAECHGAPIRIVKQNNAVLPTECRGDERVLTVNEAGLVLWFHSDRWFHNLPLPRLFDFLKQVLRIQVGENAADRLLAETHLPNEAITAVERYTDQQAHLRQQAQKDIHLFLSGLPHQQLSDAVSSLDEGFIRSLDNATIEALGVGLADLQFLLSALEENHTEKIRSGKSVMQFRLLSSACSPPYSRDPSKVISETQLLLHEELRHLKEQIVPIAQRYYTRKWLNLCMSDSVVQIDQRLFSGQLDDSKYSLRSLLSQEPVPTAEPR